MDGISSTSNPAANLPQLAGGAALRTEERQSEVQAQRVPENNEPEDVLNEQNPEEARFRAVREAAQQQINTFVVSDSRFTIYKEIEGGEPIFVTRFTSLRDGSVTVVPEPQLLQNFDVGRILQTSA